MKKVNFHKPEQTIRSTASLKAAMQELTQLNQSILAVVDENLKLLGVITDGDIRRALINNASLNDQLKPFYNKKPVSCLDTKNDFDLVQFMKSNKIDRLPVINSEGKFVRFKFSEPNFIDNAIPNLSGEEIQIISKAINSNFVAVGPNIADFEKSVCDYTGSHYAVATSSGTAALHLSLIAADIQPGDLVITSTFSFAASANCIRYMSASPIFMDVDEKTLCIDLTKTEEYIEKECLFDGKNTVHKQTGRIVRAILPVHVYGHPSDIDRIEKMAQKYNLVVIEDGAEALGAEYRGRRIGQNSVLCALSFNGNKIITTGAGGMVLTTSEEICDKIRYYANQCKADSRTFLHDDVGYNYRMPNINAAIGCAQMEKLRGFVKQKREIAKIYKDGFEEIDSIKLVWEADDCRSSFWMPVMMVQNNVEKFDPENFVNFMISSGVGIRNVWHPLHKQKAYSDSLRGDISNADDVEQKAFCLPSSTNISRDDQNTVIKKIKDYFQSN